MSEVNWKPIFSVQISHKYIDQVRNLFYRGGIDPHTARYFRWVRSERLKIVIGNSNMEIPDDLDKSSFLRSGGRESLLS